MRDVFQYTTPCDPDNEISVAETRGGKIVVSVADEKAIDSYNSVFECEITLPRHEAERLRDYLNRVLKNEDSQS